MSAEDNKAVVVRWFTDFWGSTFDARVIDEFAAPDIRFEYSLHQPLRGRDEVREFALRFREAFPDLGFAGTAHRGRRLRRRAMEGRREPQGPDVRRSSRRLAPGRFWQADGIHRGLIPEK